MAGGNNTKGASNRPSSSSSSSHRKSRWESEHNKNPPINQKLPVAGGNSRNLPPPPPAKSKPLPNPTNNNPPPNPSLPPHKPLPGPSPSGAPFPFADNHGPLPPPSYGFHMLDRRSIGLADGSVRSYFALPPDYHDFGPPVPVPPPPRFLPNHHEMNGPGFVLDRSHEFMDGGNRTQEYHYSLSQENSLKRKFVDDGELSRRDGGDERIGLARQRQQLLQYGNGGFNANGHMGMAGTSNAKGHEDEMRAAKYMRGEEVGHNVGRIKHDEVDQEALKKAFFHFVKLVNENVTQRKNFLVDGKLGPVKCLACSRSSKDFSDMHALVMHTYDPNSAESLTDHLGLHKTLCILMGWNWSIPPDDSKQYQLLSADEAAANQADLIIWPPHVIIHNTLTGKGRDGRIEGLGNRAMDIKLRDLGFTSGKSKSLYGREGHLGVTLVKFAGDQSGLREAERLAEFLEKDNHGRQGWAVVQNLVSTQAEENNPNLVTVDKNTGSKERILYGYLGTASDLDKVAVEILKKVVIASKREYNSSKIILD